MLTVESVLNWLQQKSSGDLQTQEDAKSFLEFLQRSGISSYEAITDDHYYDWIDTKV